MKIISLLCLGASIVVAGDFSSRAVAQGASRSAQLKVAKEAENLKPGEWVWAPEIAPDGPILVYVDVERQLATVYRNGIRIGVSTVSSGRPGFDTPTGVFTILEKNKVHHSSKYNNASMPYQQRLTMDGVALHAGGLPGYPESHGCIHLPIAFSKLLFDATPKGGTVIIAGKHGDPIKRPGAGVLAPGILSDTAEAGADGQANEDYSWNPSAALIGPVSIIVSTGDQKVVILRNGVEIGRANAVVQQQTTESQVMTLTGGDGPQWIQVGVSELTNEPSEVISTENVEKMHLPARFVTAMRSVMTAGTTVLITQASVSAGSTGRSTTVLDSEDTKSSQ